MSGFDQGSWDAITWPQSQQRRASHDLRCQRAIEYLLPRLGLSKADQRDLRRILDGKKPYAKPEPGA